MTWKKRPLSEYEDEIKSSITAAEGYRELSVALDRGIMPHQWFEAPRWSRVMAVAVSGIKSKLAWLEAHEDVK